MSRTWRSPALAGTLLLSAAPAAALVGDRNRAFGLDLALRNTSLVTRNYDAPLLFGADNSSDGVEMLGARALIEGRAAEVWSYQVHLESALTFSTAGTGVPANALVTGARQAPPYRVTPLDLEWSDADVQGRVVVDRAQLCLRLGRADLILGRQAITFGETLLWNPLDVFAPFGAAQFDREYKPGIDAARVELPWGDLGGITLVAAAPPWASEEGWHDSAVLARGYATSLGFALTAQGGRVAGGYHAGAGLSGELMTIEVRAAAAYYWSLRPAPRSIVEVPPHFEGVLGLGRRLAGSLHLEGEYFYNGGAAPRLEVSFLRVAAGTLLHANRHLAGASLSYELHPLVQSSLAGIVGMTDRSWVLQPGITYSAADEIDVLLGALLAFGARPDDFKPQSEMGSYPHFAYVQVRLYL